ncbi:DUF1189 family protein [Pontiella agarivorans]|uniref:DUF1189 family protein n=1 Tax=Pontiella agarivorans TaxID=3038953 RepID=A0ABU5MV09_9BACT|nr:DUF1189 family protein [Pontiella agarivorans]MDZ8117997.1 DUF1189 family protein [Pontiella agarivorans]
MKGAKYSMLQMPVLAFFSKRLYRDIGMNRKGTYLLYLFVLLAVCAVPLSIHFREHLSQTLGTDEAVVLNQLPPIEIRNGTATVNAEMPCYINNAAGQTVAIIDTTGSMNYIDSPTVQLMLTETRLILRGGLKIDLNLVDGLNVNQHKIKRWMDAFHAAPALFTFGISLVFTWTLGIVYMLIGILSDRVGSKFTHSMLNVKDIGRVAAVALTPAVLGFTVSSALNLPVPCYVHPAVALGYLLFGLSACSPRKSNGGENCIDLKAALKPDLLMPCDKAA